MKKKFLKIGIIGAGGIGALFGSVLQKNGNKVFFLNKSKKKNKRIKYKIKSKYYGNFKNYLFFDNKKFYNCDIFILAIKFPHLESLLSKLKKIKKSNKPVICFMNGLGHIKILKKIFKNNLILASAGHVVSYKKNFDIIHTSVSAPEIILSFKNKKSLKKYNIKKVFINSGMDTKVSTNPKKIVWEKLIRLNSLAALTSLFSCDLGKIRQFKERYFYFTQLLRETIKVAEYDGYKTNFKSVIKKVEKLPNNLRTSMQRDLFKSRQSEIDSITGEILRTGSKLGLKLPYHNLILSKIKTKYDI